MQNVALVRSIVSGWGAIDDMRDIRGSFVSVATVRAQTEGVLAACVVAPFGARFGMPSRLEGLYAALVVLACGTWDALAAATGPFTSPLPQALGIGVLALSVPWWANRRRRAKVRVERTLAAWPEIARAIGLAGSEIMAATVDLWGWRARLRLARGQTITDVMAKVPATTNQP